MEPHKFDHYRVIDNAPMSFAQWLERPFLKYLNSFQSLHGVDPGNARPCQVNEKDFQKLLKRREGKGKQTANKKSLREPGNAFAAMFHQCQKGDLEATAKFGSEIIRQCEHLYLLAEQGNEIAARCLAQVAIMATKGLEKVAVNNLEHLQGAAYYEYAWPLMISPVTSLSSRLPNYNEIGLGGVFRLDFNSKRRFELNTSVGIFAWKLLNYVMWLKQFYAGQKTSDTNQGKVASMYSPWSIISSLPDFAPDSSVINKWWKAAEHFLVEAFPHPEIAGVLNERHLLLKDLVTAKGHKKTANKHRARIIEKLEEKFWSIAGISRVQNKK